MNVKRARAYIKDAVIFALVIFAFFQTGELWFSGTPAFITALGKQSVALSSAKSRELLLRPYRVGVSVTGNKFFFDYDNFERLGYKTEADKAVDALLRYGEFVAEHKDAPTSLFERPFAVVEYAYQMPSAAFLEIKSISSNLLTTRFQSFSQIFVVPEAAGFRFYFGADGRLFEYYLQGSRLQNSALAAEIESQASREGLHYVSSALSGMAAARRNIFIADWDGEELPLRTISFSNVYEESGELSLSSLESKVNVFFANPAQKLSDRMGGAFTYSYKTTVVKYFPAGILEYSDYSPTAKDTDFLSAYLTCLNFLSRDALIKNEYYLSEYAYNSADNQWVFSFDYSAMNLPLILNTKTDRFSLGEDGGEDAEGETGINLRHVMEVAVSGDIVKRYRKSAFVFEPLEDSMLIGRKFSRAMANFGIDPYEVPDSDEDSISDAVFGYKIGKNEDVGLYWQIKSGDSTLSISAN